MFRTAGSWGGISPRNIQMKYNTLKYGVSVDGAHGIPFLKELNGTDH
jgi:hypothetical protein